MNIKELLETASNAQASAFLPSPRLHQKSQ